MEYYDDKKPMAVRGGGVSGEGRHLERDNVSAVTTRSYPTGQ